MDTVAIFPKLRALPGSLPIEGAVRIELVEGVPLFQASSQVQKRIETLLLKQQQVNLSVSEEQELDCCQHPARPARGASSPLFLGS